jgi:hypothetical protein
MVHPGWNILIARHEAREPKGSQEDPSEKESYQREDEDVVSGSGRRGFRHEREQDRDADGGVDQEAREYLRRLEEAGAIGLPLAAKSQRTTLERPERSKPPPLSRCRRAFSRVDSELTPPDHTSALVWGAPATGLVGRTLLLFCNRGSTREG